MNIINDINNSFKRYGDKKAFCIDETTYTYNDFQQHISGIAEKLTNTGNSYIGIIENDDIETYASILAVLFLGKTYIVLNPKNPNQRNLDIIEDTEISTILYSRENELTKTIDNEINIINTNGLTSPNDVPMVKAKDDNLAYIIFTSGSTGKPKGVPITYSNLNSFYKTYSKLGFNLGTEDRCLQMFDLTFDVSVVSTLFPLSQGACIYTVPLDCVKYLKVYELLEDEELTYATIPPSVLSLLKPYFDEIDLPKLKHLILTAEASLESVIKEFLPSVPNAEICNLYGPTEATIYCSCYRMDKANILSNNDMISIGKIFENMEYLILDNDLNKIEAGDKGDFYIAGEQLFKGYWKNEKQTQEAFIEINNKRYYKTGDICYENADGNIMYCGRKDHQLQIQGFRVELGEIEHQVRKIHSEGANIIIPQNDINGNIILHLCIENIHISEKVILDDLRSKLPKYMIPKYVHRMEKLPLNTSGKIDRKQTLSLINNI